MSYYTRRILPHWRPPGVPLFLTWRLYGTLPSGRRYPPGAVTESGRAFVAMDRILDHAHHGPTYLAIDEIAELIRVEIHAIFPETAAWVIMPNHVHLLISTSPSPEETAARLRLLKGRTARYANQHLCRTGEGHFWQQECYDRWIRTPEELLSVTRYIETNPVKAGLVSVPSDFRWSSAHHHRSVRR